MEVTQHLGINRLEPAVNAVVSFFNEVDAGPTVCLL